MATVASTVGRAAAILTTGEVLTTAFDMANTLDGGVTVDMSFTKGSLTNVIMIAYGSADDVTYKPLYSGVTAITETLTADGERLYLLKLPGVRYIKVGVQGTGTVTSSSCTITLRYQRAYLTSAQTDGVQRLSS